MRSSGADIVKTNWPGDQESFAKCVEAANGLPVVLAGGSRLDDAELLTRMEQAVAVGAIGCSVGRNIFMHRAPKRSPARFAGHPGTLAGREGVRCTSGGDGVMRAAFMTDVNAVEVREECPSPRSIRRRHPPSRGLRDLWHRRQHVLQR